MAAGGMLRVLQTLFRAHPEGLTIDEVVDRYGPPFTPSLVPPRAKRPKHIKGYLQRAIALGMMRAEPSALGFRYHASDSFFSLVEDRSGQLVYAYSAESAASREEQARARSRELEAKYWAEHDAEKERRQEAIRREWEAGAEKRAHEAAARAGEAAARRSANSARLEDGTLQCPYCTKTFLAHGERLSDVRADSFGDLHAVVHGLHLVMNRAANNCWGICKPEGCGRSFYVSMQLGACEDCGRWHDVPEDKRHAVCECGAFVREWRNLLPLADR
jgi:hypothetical protein